MKNIFKMVCLFTFICSQATAQQVNDFYVAFSKAKTNDTLHVYISVQKHQNISSEVFEIEVKEKGVETAKVFQISNRFPYGIVNDLNMYIYHIPFETINGVIYEVAINNKRLCTQGPLKIVQEFSSDYIFTFSYTNPGYRIVQPVKLKKVK